MGNGSRAGRSGGAGPNEAPSVDRRIFFQGLGSLGAAAALAGCAGENGNGGSAGDNTTGSTGGASTGGGDSGGSAGATGTVLATTDEVPVGGGVVLSEQQIVVTQPSEGEFKAFTAVCTHAQCVVSEPADGTIPCDCHGSRYDAATGEVTGGPAPAPLSEVAITVQGGEIVTA